jgi:hypothetical protein
MRLSKVSVLIAAFLVIVLVSGDATRLHAQNYSFDARKIALGGVANAGAGNIAFENVPKMFQYGSILIPLGLLFQALGNLDIYNPDKPDFDLVRIIDLAGNPWHYTWNRSHREAKFDFLDDIRQGELSRDLNNYRGFTPKSKYFAEGLLAANWGHTFKISKRDDESYQGFYVGAGPYIAVGTDLKFDERLIEVLGSSQNVTIPKTTYNITDTSAQQMALAITGGYRARFTITNKSGRPESERNGVYLAANGHYLRGFRYDAIDAILRIDTGADGLVTVLPAVNPVVINQLISTSGSGFALDVGLAAVIDNWELGFSVDGIGNRIKWKNMKKRDFVLNSLISGLEFKDRNLPAPFPTVEVKLPVRYTGAIAYHWKSLSAMSDLAYGFENFSFHGGFECRFSRVALRAGGRYSRERWQPSGGIGFALSERWSLDAGVFAHINNIEQVREPSLALTLRHNASKKKPGGRTR